MTTSNIVDGLCIALFVALMAVLRLITGAMVKATIEDASPTTATATTDLPANTLIEIGDATFTPDEASRLVSLRDYYQGYQTALPWRGNGNGGAA